MYHQRDKPGNPPRVQDSRITQCLFHTVTLKSLNVEKGATESSSGFGAIITELVGVRPLLRNLSVSCHRTCGPSFDHSRCIRPAVSGSVQQQQQQQQQQQHQQMLLHFTGKMTLLLFLHRVGCGMCHRRFGENCSLYLQGASKFLYTVGYTAHRHTAKKIFKQVKY